MSFQDIRIDNWIKNNHAQFLNAEYTFENFTSDLRKRFLDPHWEITIVRSIVNSQMTTQESFTTFANRVMHGNNLLIGTPSRLDTTVLRIKLEQNMSAYLADKLTRLKPTDKERIAALTVFEDWLAEISLLDEEITAELKRIADFATEHIAKKQRLEKPQPPTQPNMYYQQQHNHDTPAFQTPLSGANAIAPSTNHHLSNFRGAYRGFNVQRTGRRLHQENVKNHIR
jgi:hypothetical protein